MHPVINYELTNQVARAAIQAGRARRERGNNPVASRPAADLARRVLTLLGARST
jgi:hypothetical protein